MVVSVKVERKGGGKWIGLLVGNNVPFPFLRILLTFVSIFSLYSVHLLLKTANEGGRWRSWSTPRPQSFLPILIWDGVALSGGFIPLCSSLQDLYYMNSWGIRRLDWLGSSQPPDRLQCRTLEVRLERALWVGFVE